MSIYGKELIIDMHECNITLMTKEHISNYFKEICHLIQMEPVGQPIFWDVEGIDEVELANSPHLQGISALQWIKTSSIVIHAITGMKQIYINIFSCSDFDARLAEGFTIGYFDGRKVGCMVVDRT